MGKKYLDTKESSLESSILGVWENAVSETVARAKANLDARTKEYKVHQEKLAAARIRRENKKVTKEEVDLDEAVKHMEVPPDGPRGRGVPMAHAERIGYDSKENQQAYNSITHGTPDNQIDTAKHFMKKGLKGKELHKAVADHHDVIHADVHKQLTHDKKKLHPLHMSFVGEELKEGTKEEYEKFFNSALKKFKIDSPADLKSDEEKKKFFNYIDKNYTGEKDEDFESRLKETIGIEESFEIGTNEYRDHALDVTPGETDPEWAQARDFKVASMKEALAKIWGMEEGKNPFIKKEDDDKALTKDAKSGKTMTGKKAAIIDTKPKIKD